MADSREPAPGTGAHRPALPARRFRRWLWTVPLFVAIAVPLAGYAVLSHIASTVVPEWASHFGLRVAAREWQVSLSELAVTARGVTLTPTDSSEPVLTAGAITFDGSVRTLTRGLVSPGAYFHRIAISGGRLVLEQSRAGTWTWIDVASGMPPDHRAAALAGLHQIDEVRVDDLDVLYVESPTPARDATAPVDRASVLFSRVAGVVTGFRRVPNLDERPTTFRLAAHVAGGQVALTGEAALFVAPVRNAGHIGPPFVTMTVTLDGLGLADLSRQLPATTIVARGGTISGRVEVSRAPTGITCRASTTTSGARLSMRPLAGSGTADVAPLVPDAWEMSGAHDACRPLTVPTSTATAWAHTLSAQWAWLEAEATREAPTLLRNAAALDLRHLAGVVDTRGSTMEPARVADQDGAR